MPASTRQSTTVKIVIPRPQLPLDHINPNLKSVDLSRPPQVKFQEIIREGHATVVGRIKIPTPNGHAFILRRLDTGAISQTTMFRAAFPTASEDAERVESAWVKTSYDIAGANRSGKARFAGTWVNPDVALALADAYSLGPVIPALAQATPEPDASYRRSSKTQQSVPSSPSVAPKLPTPPQSVATPNPAKRRRESSPSQATPAAPPTPASARTTVSPGPRRSARLKSPPPPHMPTLVSAAIPKTPKSVKAARVGVLTPAGSDETMVEDESIEVTKVAVPNMLEDIREQRELIARLKAEREAEQQAMEEKEKEKGEEKEKEIMVVSTSDEGEVEMGDAQGERVGVKRTREDEEKPLAFNFPEGTPQKVERAIATNRRVRLLSDLPPQRKSLAWGALAFAAGLGAMSLLPNLQQLLF
ncbi:hypothetical protein BKA93DRAFT_900679 [Sparassis latifolia]|uniref:HTH APSES-type domain-containing protein n=1 Tax=Sparassis crispa TaxID=139825 RepID=A0A401H0N7_9APHY|nr:predicted protein [Sparassis crispa]GBE87995.1 predicted protein [Sparassis crispa]